MKLPLLSPVVAVSMFVAGATAQTPQFNTTDIGALIGTNSVAQAINARADVVGYWINDSGPAAFFYRSNQVFEITALGTNANYALAINDSGNVAGYSLAGNGFNAFFFDGTNVWDLGDWGGTNSYGTGINASNQIVGFAETTNGVTAVFFNGQAWDIGNLGGGVSYAYGINASNVIVGSSLTATGSFDAFVVNSGGMQDLNGIVQPTNFTMTTARAINAAGVIAGWGTTNGSLQAFQLNGTNLTIIPVLPGATNGYANALNNSNSVVGACGMTNGLRAFLWQNGVLYDLNSLVATNAGWVLREADGINDAGQIVGWGNVSNQTHAFLLTPNQPPTVSITSPTNSASFASPFDLTITATASDDGAIARVDFYVGTQLVGSSTTAPYAATWPDVCMGSYALTAVAYDNLGVSATSAVVTVAVTLPETASLRAWLKPESFTLTNGAPVSTWADSSGKGYNATASGTNRPTFLTNQVNGFPAIKFNGIGNYLTLGAVLTGATEGEAFIVFKPGSQNNEALWDTGNSSSNFKLGGFYDTFGFPTSFYNGYNVIAYSTNLVPNFLVYNVYARTNEWASSINGNFYYKQTIPYAYFKTPFSLCSYQAGGYYGAPCIAELILYNKKLSTAERVAVNKYLVAKYGRAALVLPATPSLTASALPSSQAYLAWTFAQTNDWIGAKIERKSSGGQYAEIARVANAFSYIDTASAGQTYYYRVKAYNVAGDSGYSQEVSVTLPQSATNSFPSGMTLWLKANTGFPKNGMNTWLDQSGAGHNGALQNVTITSVAGLAAAWFNGTSAQVTLPTGLFSSSAEIFIVLKATWTNGNGNCRGLNSLGGTGTWSTYPCSDGTVCDGFATTVTKNMGQPPVNVTAINLYNASSQANDWVCRFNGSLFFRTTANATATPSSPNIGVSSYAGSVMEVMLFNRVLSVAERYTVGAYFNAAYGLVTNAPPAPTVHCQALSPQQIAVTWNAISNAACYQVERQVDSGGFVTLALLDEQTNYTDTIWNSSPITYRISAINCIGTNQTSLTTPLTYVSSPPPGSSVFVGTNLPVTLQSVAGSTPSLVNLYANGYLRQSWSSAPYQTTLTSTSPTRWNLMSLTYDTLGNSRYSGLFGVDSLNPIDSDGDGIPDCIDAFPYDPTRWLAPTIDPNDHTPPVITITQP